MATTATLTVAFPTPGARDAARDAVLALVRAVAEHDGPGDDTPIQIAAHNLALAFAEAAGVAGEGE